MKFLTRKEDPTIADSDAGVVADWRTSNRLVLDFGTRKVVLAVEGTFKRKLPGMPYGILVYTRAPYAWNDGSIMSHAEVDEIKQTLARAAIAFEAKWISYPENEE